jgi:hypothetical protein
VSATDDHRLADSWSHCAPLTGSAEAVRRGLEPSDAVVSEREQKSAGRHRSLPLSNREAEPRARIERRSRCLGGRRREQIEVRVECVGRVDESVGGVLAEAFDPLADVR